MKKTSGMAGVGMLIGRIGISLIFILSGLGKMFYWNQTVAYIELQGIQMMLPLLITIAIIIEVLGGLSILLGFLTRTGAGLLIIYVIFITCLFHNFWALQGEQQALQLAHFFKNLAILGGLFYVLSAGAGRYSIDG